MTVSSDSDSFPLQNSVGKTARREESANAHRLPTVAARQSALPSTTSAELSDSAFSIEIEPHVEERSFATGIRRNKNPLAAFLSSTLLHAFWILLLLYFSWQSPPEKVISLIATMESVEVNAEVADPNESINQTLETFESPVEDVHKDTSDEPEVMAESEIELVLSLIHI